MNRWGALATPAEGPYRFGSDDIPIEVEILGSGICGDPPQEISVLRRSSREIFEERSYKFVSGENLHACPENERGLIFESSKHAQYARQQSSCQRSSQAGGPHSPREPRSPPDGGPGRKNVPVQSHKAIRSPEALGV